MAMLATPLGIEEVRAHRTWFLIFGVVLIILGTIAIGSAELMTMVSVLLFGWLLIFAGLFEIIHGFARRAWGGFFVNLMGGLLYGVTGLLMVSHPGIAAITLTLMIALAGLGALGHRNVHRHRHDLRWMDRGHVGAE